MLPFVGDLDAAKIHVQAPSAVIFLCGGQCSSLSSPTPLSLRDAFLKIHDNPAVRGRRLIQAEEVTSLSTFASHYKDFLVFETDLAQVTDLIILFCESEGSLAELGAFSMVEDIASRLLVVIRDKHWEEDSFVKLGPLRRLENDYGPASVFVVDDDDIGMRGRSAEHVNIKTLRDLLLEPIRTRLENTRDPTTFDKSRRGHIIKLITGLIQEYGALEISEISLLLGGLCVPVSDFLIGGYLLCATAVGWVVEKRKGSRTFYIAQNLRDAATFKVKDTATERNRTRRRLMIREHWRATDLLRDMAIRDVIGGLRP